MSETPRPEDIQQLARVLEIARRVAASRTPEAAARELERALAELFEADRTYCVFFDRGSNELWHPTDAEVADLVSASDWQDDHRVQRRVVDHSGRLHAVLVAIRNEHKAPFTAKQFALLGVLARESAPMLRRLELELEVRGLAEESAQSGPFREQVIELKVEERSAGSVIRVSPAWVHWAYRPLVTMLVLGLIYLSVGTVHRYSGGPAVVEMSGRAELTSHAAGTIVSIPVVPGEHVEAGDPIAKLYDVEEAAEVERIRGELETQLRALMRNAQDGVAAQAVRTLRGQLESAEARLSERAILAPRAGTIADLRVRPGQSVAPGEIVASLAREGEDPHVVALVPGSDRPLVERGMPVRFEIAGYRFASFELIVDEVGDEVLSPAEARRFLGPSVADGLAIEQPVVVVRMRLPSTTFVVDGETFSYHEGMRGTAEVRVREESILESLIPAVKPRRGGART